ncbi:MAG: hypothetical protein WC291_07510, partial [Thermodesulfovibrionales bacterium]
MTGGEKLVVCDSRQAMEAHRDLFHLNEEAYSVTEEKGFFSSITGLLSFLNAQTQLAPPRIHLVLGWENLILLALWKEGLPSWTELSPLLTASGIRGDELAPLKGSDTADLFPWLYYGKRFDILRKVCHKAKKQVEEHLTDRAIRVDCHLFADYARMIVASSL